MLLLKGELSSHAAHCPSPPQLHQWLHHSRGRNIAVYCSPLHDSLSGAESWEITLRATGADFPTHQGRCSRAPPDSAAITPEQGSLQPPISSPQSTLVSAQTQHNTCHLKGALLPQAMPRGWHRLCCTRCLTGMKCRQQPQASLLDFPSSEQTQTSGEFYFSASFLL